MNQSTVKAIHLHALADYPRESCGVVVVVKGRERYVRCENLASSAEEHFVLSPKDYAAADDLGEVVAIVHSHPNVSARASQADLVGCEASSIRWVIVSVMPGENGPAVADTVVIAPTGYEAPYVGRTWAHGILDCWGLCRDWYAREWHLELPNPQRADNWWDDGVSNLYCDDALGAAGFVAVRDARELRSGDLILMQVRSLNRVPNHAAIYIGDGLMLHHMAGRLSTRDVYGGYWAEMTQSVWRHAQAPT